MNKKIMDIFRGLGIPSFYQECTNKTDNYVIFSIYSEKDTEVLDNVSNATLHYVTINYWYDKCLKDLDKYKTIKTTMKSNGFKFYGCADLVGDTRFGKSLDFIYKEWN
jgi:hypothetical protein